MRSLKPSHIAASLVLTLGATAASAQNVAFPRATGTNGSTVTTSNTGSAATPAANSTAVTTGTSSPSAQPPAGASAVTVRARPRAASCSAT